MGGNELIGARVEEEDDNRNSPRPGGACFTRPQSGEPDDQKGTAQYEQE
jgi:hypothetical protein